MYVVILANSTREAMSYAAAAGLPKGRFRYALRAATIRKLRVAEVHILPGFKRRLDRHAILAELRYAKKAVVKEISSQEVTDLKLAHEQAKRALPLERALVIAHRYRAIQEAASGAEAGETEPSEDAAPAEASKRRRRSRCKTCNTLHFADEPCVQRVQPVAEVRPIFNEDGTEAEPVTLARTDFFG